MMRCLLVGVCQPEERFLAPRPTEELQSGWQRASPRETHRYRDGGKPGARRKELVVVAVWRVQVAGQTRHVAPRRIDQRIEPVTCHDLEHPRPKRDTKSVA